LDRITIEKNESVESYRKLLEFYLKYKNFKLHEISHEAKEGMYRDYVKFCTINSFDIMSFEEFIKYDKLKVEKEDKEIEQKSQDIYWEDYNSDDEDSFEVQIAHAPYLYDRKQLVARVQELNRIVSKTKDYNHDNIKSKEQYYELLKKAKYFENLVFENQNKRTEYEQVLQEEVDQLKKQLKEEKTTVESKIKEALQKATAEDLKLRKEFQEAYDNLKNTKRKKNEMKYVAEVRFITTKMELLEKNLKEKNEGKEKPRYEEKYIGKLEEDLRNKSNAFIELSSVKEKMLTQIKTLQEQLEKEKRKSYDIEKKFQS